jgi:hypothetical protein
MEGREIGVQKGYALGEPFVRASLGELMFALFF